MKKRLLVLILSALLLLLCGCGHLDTSKDLPGRWRSEDGYTAVFTGSELTVYDIDGNLIDGFPASYVMSGNVIHLRSGDTYTEVFECRIDGDSMKLIYTDSFLILTRGSAEKSVVINLTRCD